MLDLLLEPVASLSAGLFAQIASDASQASGESVANAAQNVWVQLFVILLGAGSYLLIQEGVLRGKTVFNAGVLLALVTAGLAVALMPFSLESYITFAFFALAGGGAVAFLSAREPVYAALGFTTTVLSVCGILFMLSALFIAAATMIVYAGATIIIFLFVLMFAQQSNLRAYDLNLTNPYLATAIGTVLLVTVCVCVLQPGAIPQRKTDNTRLLSEATTYLPEGPVVVSSRSAEISPAVDGSENASDDVAVEIASAADPSGDVTVVAEQTGEGTVRETVPETTAELGRSLYTDYLAAIDLAGILLLVATLGAIALATRTTAEVNG